MIFQKQSLSMTGICTVWHQVPSTNIYHELLNGQFDAKGDFAQKHLLDLFWLLVTKITKVNSWRLWQEKQNKKFSPVKPNPIRSAQVMPIWILSMNIFFKFQISAYYNVTVRCIWDVLCKKKVREILRLWWHGLENDDGIIGLAGSRFLWTTFAPTRGLFDLFYLWQNLI